jgi:hypothetical protein
MHASTAKRRATHVSKDKRPPRGPQLFPPALTDLRWSPIWRQQQEVISKLRERLPRYKLEELERLRAMLRAPHLPDFSLPPELEAQLRDWHCRLPEPEQSSEQGIEHPAEQPPGQLVNRMPERIERVVFEQTIEQPIGQARPADQAQTVEPVSTWIEQVLEQIGQAAGQPDQAAVLQEEESKRTTNQKHPGGRPPISPELIQAAQEEYRRALEGDGHLKNHKAASTHLNAWLAKSRWAEKFKTLSLSSWERHVIRSVLRPSGATSSDRQNSTVI